MLLFIRKCLYFLLRKVEKPAKKEDFKEIIDLGANTILLPNTKFDFRTGKEKRQYITTGERCLLGVKFIFETPSGSVSIGNNVSITDATFICKTKIEIHDDVTMAWGITLYDHNSHSIYWEDRKNDNQVCFDDYVNHNGNTIVNKDWTNVVSKPIIINAKVWIGFDVTILKGVEIGEGAVIGAKSVVTKDIPAWSVAAGNPAKIIKMIK